MTLDFQAMAQQAHLTAAEVKVWATQHEQQCTERYARLIKESDRHYQAQVEMMQFIRRTGWALVGGLVTIIGWMIRWEIQQ